MRFAHRPAMPWTALRVAHRGEQFAFFLRSRLPEPGRAAYFDSFWRNEIDEVSLQQAFALLDRDLIAP